MTTLNRLAAAAGAVTLITMAGFIPALAQGTPEERSACMSDAFTFCGSAIPDVDKVTACLKENVSRISPACQAEFQQGGVTKIKAHHFNR